MRRVREFESIEEALEPDIRKLKEKGIRTRLSPIFRTPAELQEGGPVFLDMVDHALVLHDRNRRLQRYLGELKEQLKKSGARRVTYKGAWYWDLQPDADRGGDSG